MKNKKLLIGGAIAVGAVLFLYLRKKKAETQDEAPVDTGAGSGSGSGTGAGTGTGTGTGSGSGTGTTTTTTTTTTGTSTAKLSNFEVTSRVLKACGVTPPSFRKQARNNWDNCKDKLKAELRSQGLISFNGLDDENTSHLDFDGGIQD
jgi:hypothetical protein